MHDLRIATSKNQSIFIESIGKVVSTRFIMCWPLKTKQRWMKETSIFVVEKYESISRNRIKNVLKNIEWQN